MCSICRCFGWILDITQRIISFLLACVMCCAICIGCVVAAGAGIAYGYNLSLAEYIDLKRSDVTVYIRRGQFGDKMGEIPSVGPFRRSGDSNDLFASNYSVDYQDHKIYSEDGIRSLSESWQKAQDTKNYADKLTKYSKMKDSVVRTDSKIEDDFLEHFAEDDTPTSRPPLSTKSGFEPEQENTREVVKLRQSSQDEDEDNKVNTIGLRRNFPLRRPKKKKPDKKSNVDVNLDENTLYLKPNVSKFLYSREDFEDSEEDEVQHKPL